MKFLNSLLLIFTLGSCAQNLKKDTNWKDDYAQYKSDLKKLIHLNTNLNDSKYFSSLERLSESLIYQSSSLFKHFYAKHPQCQAFLQQVEKDTPKMLTLNIEQIEDQYHAGNALPKSDDICFEMKELIVHPATVILIGKNNFPFTKAKVKVAGELEELYDHLDEINDYMR